MAYLQKGYLCVYNGHGRIRQGGQINYPLHRLIYEEAHGVVLPRGVIVHHRNEDPLDNRIENLEAVTRAEHPTRHRRSVREGERRCGRCRRWRPLAAFAKRQKRCKACAKKTHATWVESNPDSITEYNRRRRQRYAERVAA